MHFRFVSGDNDTVENMPYLAHSYGKASDQIEKNGTHGQHVTCAHELMTVCLHPTTRMLLVS